MNTLKIGERLNLLWMWLCVAIVILIPFILGAALYLKSQSVLENSDMTELLFSSEWKPMQGKFGFLPFIAGSVYVTLLALVISVPLCLLTAIYMTHYARKRSLQIMQSVVDVLAGIPSVVYGVWGVVIIVPFIARTVAPFLGTQSSGYTLLSGALVLSIMIIPFMLNIMIEVLKTIPEELTEASLSLGTTRWQTIKHVILRKAFPGIISAVVFGLARAFGETIAVLMVVGNVPVIPKSLMDPAYPLPALIANNYGEMLSIPGYDSALMLAALILFVIVMLFNLASRLVIARLEYRHQ